MRGVVALWLGASVALLSVRAGADGHGATPRISGGSTTLDVDHFVARVFAESDPRHRVSRVGFTLQAACPGDAEAAQFATTPEVFGVAGAAVSGARPFEANVPDPSRGRVGAWKLHVRALDDSGGVLARYGTDLVRSFPIVWQTEPRPARVDTSGAAGVAKVAFALVHDTPIVAVGLQTSLHDDPRLGVFMRGGVLETDPRSGAMTGLTSRIERSGPTSFVAEFTFPPDSPEVRLGVERIFARDARCRAAEDQIWSRPNVVTTSRAPRAVAVGVRFDPSALADGRIKIDFQHVGPKPRSDTRFAGLPVPIVDVRVWRPGDTASPIYEARAKVVPGSPLGERPWDGESMSTSSARVSAAVLEAVRRGVEVEIDDGGTPVRPRVLLGGGR